MTIQSLGPPPQTGDAVFDQWLFLLWTQEKASSSGSSDSTIANLMFGPHLPAPITGSTMGADSQLQLSVAAFRPHSQVPVPVNLLAVDSNSILAGQIFGG